MDTQKQNNPAIVVSNTVLENVRWIALTGQFITIAIVHFALNFPLPLTSCLIVVAASAIVGIWQSIRRRQNKKMSQHTMLWLLVFDTTQLGVLIYLTGGIINPFSIMLLAPVTISATALPRKNTLALVALVVAMASFLAFHHNPLPWGGDNLIIPHLYVGGLWTALVLTTIFIAAYAGIVARNSRQLARGLADAQLTMAREQQMVALGSLATAAAHKLGSPLNTITLIAHDLSKINDKSNLKTIHNDLDALIAETERCRLILKELNEDAIKLGQEIDDPIPIQALIQSLIEERFQECRHIISISLDPHPNTQPPLVIRRPELTHAIETILDNAAQFAQNNINLNIQYDTRNLTITITDDGKGFQSAVLANLGAPYNSSRSGTDGHMGLGIFIAMTMIEQIGGKITFENKKAGQNKKSGGASVAITYPRDKIESKDTSQ